MAPEHESSSEKVPQEVMDRLREKFDKLISDYYKPLVEGEERIINDGPAADCLNLDPDASIFGPVDSKALRDYVGGLSMTSEIVEEQLS